MVTVKKVTKSKKQTLNKPSKLLDTIFEKSGFTSIKSDGIEITFNGMVSEIDNIFAFENVLIICEKTSAKEISTHFPKKKLFAELIESNKQMFLTEYRIINLELDDYIKKNNSYDLKDFEIRYIYLSELASFSSNILSNSFPFILMSAEIGKYFLDLSKIINKSCRFELFKFLNIALSSIGQIRLSGQDTSTHNFQAFVLPVQHTNYPDDFIVVSFYIDPEALIKRAYVLRRDGWENSSTSYQRFVKKIKLQQMRRYLAAESKVFINNLIITMPPSVVITNRETKQPISASQVQKIQHVSIGIPNELGIIGIVDGQHRALAYYEGSDEEEIVIKKLRIRQNLLVTGIIFPEGYSSEDKIKFEAELFLKINNTQTGVSDALKQELETIINPLSSISVAKLVTSALSVNSPLSGLIQATIYDGVDKIRTASFSRYAMLSLVNPTSNDSLYSVWSQRKIELLTTVSERNLYVEFCRERICTLLAGLRINLPGAWAQSTRKETTKILTPTTIGGFLIYLRHVVQSKIPLENIDYKESFKNLSNFPFNAYASSKWAKCGSDLYSQFPPKLLDPNEKA